MSGPQLFKELFHGFALALGFEDPAYFSRSFTRIMGMSPSEYRKREKTYASVLYSTDGFHTGRASLHPESVSTSRS